MHFDTARARDALQYISPNLPRDEWVRVGMAAKAAGLDFETWDAWCANGDTYSPRDARDTWRSIRPAGGITAGSLFHAARAAGWREDGKPQQTSPSKAISRPVEPPRTPRKGMAAAEVWGRCEPATAQHPYCVKKGIDGPPLAGLRVVSEGDALRIRGVSMAGALAVPARDADGRLQSLQLVPADGPKMNLPGCAMAGARFIVGTPQDGAALYLCEGIGAAWACWQATGHAAICAFGWGNVGRVAADIRQRDVSARLVLVPDVGKEQQAAEIARELGCSVACLPEGEPPNFDCNDFAQREGHDVLRELLESASEPPAPAPHPLAVYVDMAQPLRPPSWLLPGFMSAEPGLTDIAGWQGVGKTSSLLPLAAGVCGFHPEGWPLAPQHWRHCVYIVEDVPQALRVLHGYARHIETTVEAIAERLHLVEARRLEPSYLVEVGPIYRQQFTRTAEGVQLLPLAVFDTRAACVASEDENNNAEASAVVAAFKQGFAGLPVWVVGHVSKAIRSAAEVAQLSSRGASAWGADANCTSFIYADGEGRDAPRYFELGKVRYEPRWRAVRLVSHVHETVAQNEFGAWEPLTLRWAIAEPADKENEREVAQAAREAAKAEREKQEAAEAAQRLRDEILQAIGDAWAQGNPLPRSNVAAVIARKRDSVRDALLALEHAGEVGEVFIPGRLRRNPGKKAFLVLLSPEEREARARGELAEVVREIPLSWRKTEADEAPEDAGEQAPEEAEKQAVPVLPQDFQVATENEAKTA